MNCEIKVFGRLISSEKVSSVFHKFNQVGIQLQLSTRAALETSRRAENPSWWLCRLQIKCQRKCQRNTYWPIHGRKDERVNHFTENLTSKELSRQASRVSKLSAIIAVLRVLSHSEVLILSLVSRSKWFISDRYHANSSTKVPRLISAPLTTNNLIIYRSRGWKSL